MAIKASDLLRLIKLSRSGHDLKPLYSLITVHGLESHESLIEEFFASCFHLGFPGLALSAFRRVEKPRLGLTSSLIRCLGQCGLYDDVLRVYSRCRNSAGGLTLPSAIKACAGLGAERVGREMHCVALRTGFGNNVLVQTALVHFYAKCGRFKNARQLLNRIPQRDLVPWNALISGYSVNGLDGEAIAAFGRLLGTGLRPNLSTLASVIPVCSRLGRIGLGESLHCYAVKAGYLGTDFLVPALISMYAGETDLQSLQILFDSMVERSVSVWNALIFAYTQMKMHVEAFSMFVSMLENSVQPNLISLVSVIPSCEDVVHKPLGESLHAFAVKHGSSNRPPVLAALMSMYAKLGDVDSVECIFHRMPYRNRLSWNSLISGYVSNGLWESSLVAFREMRFSGFDPDEVSIISVISACTKLEAVSLGESAHAFGLQKGFGSALNVSNALLAFYAGSHKLSSCLKLFDEMPIRSTISWNTLISCCVNNCETTMSISVLRRMKKEGVETDPVTLISILPIFDKSESVGQGMAIHCIAIKSGFSGDISLANALITMYCNCGHLETGQFLFDEMPGKCVVSWNVLLTGFRDRGSRKDVLVLFDRMVRERKRPNHITLLSLLPCVYSQLQGKSVHGFAIRAEIARETTVFTSLMFMYARFDNVRLCHVLFRAGKLEDISLWNAMISVLSQSENPRTAIAVFSDLLRTGLEPDNFTAQGLISACVRSNSPKLADSIVSYLLRKALDKDVTVSNGLIDMYAKSGDIEAARKLFDRATRKDIVSWSVMINGYGLHGNGKAALDIFSWMAVSGIEPDRIVYSAILSACSHSGLAEEGLRVFQSMPVHGISPGPEHYACIVDLLARTGNLLEAQGIVERMPLEPSTGLLEALLGGCGAHENVEIGEEIGRKLSESDPGNSRVYVMLHNVYASAGRWFDAERVRSEIEKRRLRKVPGFSLFVADGT